MNFKKITNMSELEAREFLLTESAYTNLDFPSYISFKKCLKVANNILTTKKKSVNKLCNITERRLSEIEDINYSLITNKDNLYSWRPITLVHPILYVDLVNTITEQDHWRELSERFEYFKEKSMIKCVSIPGKSISRKKDKAETILNWWEKFEQEQISLSLEYNYCMHTDISNCYSSIYTHSIAWAIMDKDVAKKKKKEKNELGNILDFKIQNMQHGQTNGIPQGSVVMDFIAELVLGYTDVMISQKIETEKLEHDIKIIRYRDDYRIFGNKKEHIEEVTKLISETLVKFNFSLNKFKTFESKDIIMDAVKEDKRYWNRIFHSFARDINPRLETECREKLYYKSDLNLQKQLLIIKEFSVKYPNSGQLKRALADFYDANIFDLTYLPFDYLQLISITVDIMVRNSSALKQSYAIVGKLLDLMEHQEDKKKIAEKIRKKLGSKPHTEYSEIWLQSLDIAIDETAKHLYDSQLAKSINENDVAIWESNWLKESARDQWVDLSIIDIQKLKEHSLILDPIEVSTFKDRYYQT